MNHPLAAAAPFTVRMRRVASAFGSGLSGRIETTVTRVSTGLFPLPGMASRPERLVAGRCRSRADHLVIHGRHHERVVEIDGVDLLELRLGGVALRRWRSGLPVPIVTHHADRADAAAQLAWEMVEVPRPEPTTYR